MSKASSWAIAGGRFGLYGYLPALVHAGATDVAIDQRHRVFCESRSELHRYLHRVRWVADLLSSMDCIDGLVFAVPPAVQENLVAECARKNFHCGHLILEKPLGRTPAAAATVLDIATYIAPRVRVGFTMLALPWALTLSRILNVPGARCSIAWNFNAHHMLQSTGSWKGRHADGGGALRFYGIHLLAVFANLGATQPKGSDVYCDNAGRCTSWRASFETSIGSSCDVEVDCSSSRRSFEIKRLYPEICVYVADDPFEKERSIGGEDPRVPLLQTIVNEVLEASTTPRSFYDACNRLWLATEAISRRWEVGEDGRRPQKVN